MARAVNVDPLYPAVQNCAIINNALSGTAVRSFRHRSTRSFYETVMSTRSDVILDDRRKWNYILWNNARLAQLVFGRWAIFVAYSTSIEIDAETIVSMNFIS